MTVTTGYGEATIRVRVRVPSASRVSEYVRAVTTTPVPRVVAVVSGAETPEWKRVLEESRNELARGEGVYFETSASFLAALADNNGV